MRHSIDTIFCLSCGVEVAEPLRRTASLRCHDCREAGAPISFELALRAREVCRAEARQWSLGAVPIAPPEAASIASQ
jgi:hypothetical protein